MYCRSQHLALQYCDIIAMFYVLQGTTASTAVPQHHSHIQCTAGITVSHRCFMYCRYSTYCRSQYFALQYCDVTAMFNVLQVLQHHSDVQCTAGIATSQRCSMYCRYCNITAMFYVLQVLQHHSDVLCTAGHSISRCSNATL